MKRVLLLSAMVLSFVGFSSGYACGQSEGQKSSSNNKTLSVTTIQLADGSTCSKNKAASKSMPNKTKASDKSAPKSSS